MIDDAKLEELRQQLETERAQLTADLSDEIVDDEEPDYNLDRGDLANESRRQHREEALRSIDQQKLEQIEDALARMGVGTYGQCENCAEMINIERLQALPSATLCISCQAKADQEENA